MAEDSSELDEMVQVASWHAAATTLADPSPAAAPAAPLGHPATEIRTTAGANPNKGNSSSVTTTSSKIVVHQQALDDSTTNGFTTAPATSDDDFESDDDDDSRSNYSNKNRSNINSMISNSAKRSRHENRHAIKGEIKRSHHNVLERKRRDLLKDSFAMLRDSVPMAQAKERVSRAEILKQAADFIQSTVKRNASVREELDELIRRNRAFDVKQEPQDEQRLEKKQQQQQPQPQPQQQPQQQQTAVGNHMFSS